MKKSDFLTVNQMNHLDELGFKPTVEQASGYYYHGKQDSLDFVDEYYGDFGFEKSFGDILTLNFEDILNILPGTIDFPQTDSSYVGKLDKSTLKMSFNPNFIYYESSNLDDHINCSAFGLTRLEAAYELLCKLIKLGYVKNW